MRLCIVFNGVKIFPTKVGGRYCVFTINTDDIPGLGKITNFTRVGNDLTITTDAPDTWPVSLAATVTTKVADYVATDTDQVIRFTANATLTLPAATGSGTHFFVRAVGATVTIDGNGSDTINEELTQVLNAGDSIQIIDEAVGLWGIY